MAISNPVSELVSRSSALVIRSHARQISTAVYTSNGRHRRSRSGSCPRYAITGSSTNATGAVRKKMSVCGATSLTATRISRYGTPQMTPRAPKSTHPRRDTSRTVPQSSSSSRRPGDCGERHPSPYEGLLGCAAIRKPCCRPPAREALVLGRAEEFRRRSGRSMTGTTRHGWQRKCPCS